MGLAGEELEGFCDLDGGGEVDGGGEYAGGVAGLYRAGWGLGEDAGQAGGGVGGRSRKDSHGGGVGSDGGGIDPWRGLLDGVVVDEIAGLEVVGSVEDEMGGGEELVDVGGDKIGDVGVDGDGGVEEGNLAASSFGLGERLKGIGLVEEDLALEVGGLDEVAVDEGEGADTGSGEEGGCCRSGGSAADDGDVRGGEHLLAMGSDAGEEDLTGVAVVVGDGGVRGGRTGAGG
ncbi:MAG: hypothetical protein JWQ42_987 [Edaphobacter sp.]|nr:hypothetical protein [Edaphobacter sp.]